MPRAPVPYPLDFSAIAQQVLVPKTAMLTAPGVTAITGDAAWTYSADNPGTYPAPGWFSSTPAANIANLDGNVIGSHIPVNQKYTRNPFTPGTHPGLAANKIVRVQGIMDWYRYTYAVAPVARVYTKANGSGFTNVPGTLVGPGSGPQPFNIVVACDASGHVTMEFGVYLDDGNGSISIGATLVEAEIVSVVADPWDFITDSAVLFHNGTTPISISKGSVRFQRNAEFEEYDFPGRVAPVWGGDEISFARPAIQATLMNVGEAPFLVYEAGGSWSSSAYDRTLTPHNFRTKFAGGVYLDDFRCVWKLHTGGFIQVRFPKALCKYDVDSEDKNEGGVPVIIEARQNFDGTTSPKAIPVHYWDRMPSTWAPIP